MPGNNEWICTTRMGEYVRIERATIIEKIEWACTTRNDTMVMKTIVNCSFICSNIPARSGYGVYIC